jgi:hypothetical protein
MAEHMTILEHVHSQFTVAWPSALHEPAVVPPSRNRPVRGCGMESGNRPSYPVKIFPETDYRFGAGPLRITVEHIEWSIPVVYDGETWYEIAGVEQTSDGREIGRRRVLVKASQLSSLPGNRRP